MASGFFCVAGAWHLELGAEARTDDGVERLVLDLHPMGPAHPLAQRLIRGEAFGVAQGLLQAGEHLGRERDRFAPGDIGGQQGGQPAGGLDGPPMANGVTMDAQQARHVLAGAGLPTGQQVQHLQAGLLMAIVLMWQALLERGDRFADRRDGVAHASPSRQE